MSIDVLTVGETLISFRHDGPLRLPATLWASPAGAESNVAIGLARLGHSVQWVSRMATDIYADQILSTLRAESVGVDYVAYDDNRPTGMMTLVQRTADRAAVTYHRAGSAASALSVDDVATMPTPRIVHLTGITPALSHSAHQACLTLADAAKRAGALISFDINYRAKLWDADTARPVLTHFTNLADIVIGGEEELDLIGTTPAQLLDNGARIVVQKLGADGAEAWDSNGHYTHRGVDVTVVDPVGAGDGFCAGFLSALLDGQPVATALARGNEVGAFAVSTAGDWYGYPHRNELGMLGGQETTLR